MLDLPEEILSALPASSRDKLEKHLGDKKAAYAAYCHASDAEQEIRADHGRVLAAMKQRQAQPRGFTLGRQPVDPDVEARLAAPVEATERAMKAAIAARERAAEKQNAYGFLEDVVRWLQRTAVPGTQFEAVEPDPAIAKTKNPMAALVKIRAQINALAEEFATIERAPAPADDLKARAYSEIDQIAAEGCPTIYATTRSGSPINLGRTLSIAARHTGGETSSVSIIGTGGAPFFVWLMQDEIKKKISDMIDTMPLDDAMTDDAREEAFRRISEQRLTAERQEESLVEMLESEGRIVARRADLDPRAYLMINA